MAIPAIDNVEDTVRKKGERPGRTLILGLGNILLKDEGFGVHVAQALRDHELPESAEVIDGGTSSLDVLLCREGIKKLIVIDVIKGGGEPGTIYRMKIDRDDRRRLGRLFSAQSPGAISLHQLGLIEALAAAEKLNIIPGEIVIIGVEPQKIEWGLELTDTLKEKVLPVTNLVLEEA